MISCVLATLSLGKFCIEMPVFVVNIGDECVLGENFLQNGNNYGLFKNTLGLTRSEVGERAG